ncbi:MAG: hypothetical protein ACRDXD_11295 [Acidimicrobiia bacterium]
MVDYMVVGGRLAVATAMALVWSSVSVVPASAADLYSTTAAARGSALPRLDAAASVAAGSAAAQAAAGQLFHTGLSGLLGVCGSVAETVGRGPSVSAIFDAFQASGSHWSIISSSKWTSMGAGQATGADGLLYVSLVFCQGAGGSSQSAAPSAAPSTSSGASSGSSGGGNSPRTAGAAPVTPPVHFELPKLREGSFPTGDSIGVLGPAGEWSLAVGPEVASAFEFGQPADLALACDWDGDGVDTVGVFRPTQGSFLLRNSHALGTAEIQFAFGAPEDVPVCGDWDGDGVDTIGVYRSVEQTFYLRNSNSGGPADLSLALGDRGDLPVAGDWDGDGVDTVGVYRPTRSQVFLLNDHRGGAADLVFDFGQLGDRFVVGDWDGDGRDGVGVFRPAEATFHLSNRAGPGGAEVVLAFGTGAGSPVVGDWRGFRRILDIPAILSP